jgi:phage terminase small subunit
LGIHELDDDTAAALAGMDVQEVYEGSGESRQFIGYTKKYKLPDKGANLERLMKHLGLFELDNSQKTDPLTSLLHAITGGNSSGFKPVAHDPEHDDE